MSIINDINKEPFLKRMIISVVIITTLIFSMFMFFQYKNLKDIYNEQNEINKRIVGSLVNELPESEQDIVNAIFSGGDEYKTLGEDILDKYGYDKSYSMSENINFEKHLQYFLVNNLIVFAGILILIMTSLICIITHIFNKATKLNNDIENIITDRYEIKEKFDEEGVFARIYTDLNKLDKTLRRKMNYLNKEKEEIKELVTDISHQLKTPLASLKLYNTLLLEEELEEEERIEFLQTNDNSINKLHNLIDSLINISRLEASMINIKKENKSIKDTLNKAIYSAKSKARLKNVIIEDEDISDFEDVSILHDSKWTEECIFNVIENAIKYTPKDGNVRIKIENLINFVRIDIIDNGIGIEKSEYNNIFKRFYRSEEVEDIEGSGVGLYLSRKILEQQGSNIIVSSEKGVGSTFSLFLTKL